MGGQGNEEWLGKAIRSGWAGQPGVFLSRPGVS